MAATKSTKATREKEKEFFILTVNRKQLNLVRVKGRDATAVTPGWPIPFQDDYEYARSTRGTSFGYSAKGFEKDKSIVKEHRFIAFLKHADQVLKKSLPKKANLVVAGTDRDRADFLKNSRCGANLIGEVKGSFSAYNHQKLIESSLPFAESL